MKNTEDFDVSNLSRYLHLTPAQVARLAERGQLPARRIGGQWRFSRAEIHHWLEDRLGAGGSEELAHVENVLEQSRSEIAGTLAAALPQEAIRLQLDARTKNSVITSMVELAGKTGWLWDIGKMTEAVKARENLHSTALENGVALLHPRRPLPHILGDSFLAFGRTSSGIPFGSERLTDIFFLICALDDETHLNLLARLSRLITDDDFLVGLRSAQTAQAAAELLISTEERLFPN